MRKTGKHWTRKAVTCPKCNGSGNYGYFSETMQAFLDFECPVCKGKGWVDKRKIGLTEQEAK